MIATLDYIQRKFQEYNAVMFEGRLQPLPFRLSSARTFLGAVKCRRKRQFDGTWHYSDFVFVISAKVSLPEDVVEDTIIHEMIHYWIFSNQMQDSGPHGHIFKGKMEEINTRFDRHVSVRHRNTKTDWDNDREVRQHLICISKLRGDRTGITIANRSKLFMLWDSLPKIPQVLECRWYSSLDPFFNRYPRSSSLKIYHISPDDLEEHRKDFVPMVRDGNTVRIEKTP